MIPFSPNIIPTPGPEPIEWLAVRQRVGFDWSYDLTREGLVNLYEKGKRSGWNASEDLDWEVDVDFDRILADRRDPTMFNALLRPPQPLRDHQAVELSFEINSWMLSQFLHGEQGALLTAARLVETVPRLDMKLYAANQASDEARHVELYRRYIADKVGSGYEVSPEMRSLLGNLVTDSRWDIGFLGMQIMVEGLALAAFGLMHVIVPDEPLLQDITRRVIADEARHVAFGVQSLEEIYSGQLSSQELKEREEFVIEATLLLHDRLLMHQVWERLGWPVDPWTEWARRTPFMLAFRKMLFSKIVPSLRRIGLLTPRVRGVLEELDLLRFATQPDLTEDQEIAAPAEFLEFVARLGENQEEPSQVSETRGPDSPGACSEDR